jgi:hypothetical protein
MSIVLSAAVKKKIESYHKYHDDTEIEIVRVIQDSDGYDAVLVRVTDSHGDRYSCIDFMDSEGDFSEFNSVEIERELEMVENFERDEEVSE